METPQIDDHSESTTSLTTVLTSTGNGKGGAANEVDAALAAVDRRAPRRWPVLLVGVALGALGAAATSAFLDGDDAEGDPSSSDVELTTVAVAQQDLIEEIEWSGTLGYGDSVPFAGNGGTVTAGAAVGSLLDRGDVLIHIDDQPTVVFYGDTPMWRPLSEGDEGHDVQQIEANLAALGYDPYQTVDIDQTFTANTAAMVERWQSDIGREITGSVELGSVLIVEGPSVVSTVVDIGSPASGPVATVIPRSVVHDVVSEIDGIVTAPAPAGTVVEDGTELYRVGDVAVVAAVDADPPADADRDAYVDLPAGLIIDEVLVSDGESVVTGGPILTLSGSRLSVDLTVDVVDADEFEIGQNASIVLPDETEVGGTVTTIGPVVQPADPQASPTVEITIGVDPDVGTEPVEGAVTVITAGEVIESATVVPTRALVALAEGGFAVVRARGGGETELIGIEIGTFDDGLVEVVEGDLVPGDDVVVPR